MELRPTNEFLDRYVAPEMSSFTAASIPDMSRTTKWLLSFILNSCFHPVGDNAFRSTTHNYLRKAEGAFREYGAAREVTLAYLANPDANAVSEYFTALDQWEGFLSQAYQAWCLLARGQKILFSPGDGSVLQRLNLLYNRTKHAEKAITSNQLPPDGTLPVWLKNDGLNCVGGSLSFGEMAEILEDLATFAEAAQDPLTMREKIQKAYGIIATT